MILRNVTVALTSGLILLGSAYAELPRQSTTWSWATNTASSHITPNYGIEEIVPKVIQSVVSITTMKTLEIQEEEMEITSVPEVVPEAEEDAPLEDFLNDSSAQSEMKPGGYGSGFFISDNLIVTNHHVIEGGVQNEYRITLHDNPWYQYKAKLISFDVQTDIALLKIIIPDQAIYRTKPLKIASTMPNLGESLFAIGHPHGLRWTVTRGITSGLNRLINNVWQTLLQTDTAVNPGNSGGPLFNMRGEVVGVNVMILGQDPETGQANETGLNFAIMGDTARHVINELLQFDRVRRPRFGVAISDVDGFNSTGILITDVEPDSPAERAGFLENDIITHANENKFANTREFFDWFSKQMPNTSVAFTVIRESNKTGASNTITLNAVFDERLPETEEE